MKDTLEEEIILAIQKKNLRRILQETEQKIRKRQKARKRMLWSISSVAAAACLLWGVFFLADNSMQQVGEHYYAELAMSSPRSGNTADSLLIAAYEHISMEQHTAAQQDLEQVITLINSESFEHSEEGQYHQQIAKLQHDKAQWLQAISLMKQGKKRKARALLTQIAKSESAYREKAAEALAK
ncbi:MAG: hypothetical protein ACK5LR_09355 [Mangrovibacterium sp.]